MIFETLSLVLEHINDNKKVLDIIDCKDYLPSSVELYLRIKNLYKPEFSTDDQIVFVIDKDYYDTDVGSLLESIQIITNTVDISNFFVSIITSNKNVVNEYQKIFKDINIDPVPFNLYIYNGSFDQVKSTIPRFNKYKIINIEKTTSLESLNESERKLLFNSKHFCLAPWVHLMIAPNGSVHPCCVSTQVIGTSTQSTLQEIWNSTAISSIRHTMLKDEPVTGCERCYIDEQLGKESHRKEFNQKFLNQVNKIYQAQPDFSLNYWDTRFNNLCNLTCRSCHPLNSSSWYKPALDLGIITKTESRAILDIEKNSDYIFDQLLEHVDKVDEIYFAGGEPLIMQRHYDILNLLLDTGRTDVRLTYTTNFTQITYKNQKVFDYWKKFNSVSVSASLDAEGARAEYLRTGTKWNEVIQNRQQMLEECPNVDFWISSTVGIINALHLPDLHQSWVRSGLIEPKDFGIGFIHRPQYLNLRTAPDKLRTQIIKRYRDHLSWLESLDTLGRATNDFRGVIKYLEKHEPFNKDDFWDNVNMLDDYYNTKLLSCFPELDMLQY